MMDPELQALFDWNPPLLELALDASKSKHSRQPSFYDKHLSQNLVLAEVIRLPSLHRDLAGVVDHTLSSLQDRGIVLPATTMDYLFPTQMIRLHRDNDKNQPMINEKSVANFYLLTTAEYCIPVASTLALHPKAPSWRTILEYDHVPSKSNYAIADGVLRIRPTFKAALLGGDLKHMDTVIMNALDGSKKPGLIEMARRFSDFMTSEVKSLSVAPEEMMSKITDLADTPFPWVRCHDVNCGRHDITFGLHGRDDPFVDATDPPWNFPPEASSSHQVGTKAVPRTMRQRVDRQVKIILSHLHLGGNQELPSDGESNSTPKPPHKPPKGKGKRKREGDDDGDYKPHKTPTPVAYLQQAWAQAVRNDATLISLHAGSIEYIGVRHRATQRLYLSELIHAHTCKDPGYGKLQIGLYIAALEDALNRALQLAQQDSGKPEERDPSVGGLGSGSGDGGDSHDARGRHLGGGGSGSGGSGSGSGGHGRVGGSSSVGQGSSRGAGQGSQKEKEREEDLMCTLLYEASLRNIALIYLQYGIYDSPVPASFIRNTASILYGKRSPRQFRRPSPGDKWNFRPNEYMDLILTSEIAEGATGIIHGATLQIQTSDGKYLRGDVVVKLALCNEQKHVNGLPTVLGIFDDLEQGPSILVMTHAGACLHRGQAVSPSTRASLLTILQDIHKAGILHSDLRAQNLLVDEFGKATIIDFDQSMRGASNKDKERECAELILILDTLCAE